MEQRRRKKKERRKLWKVNKVYSEQGEILKLSREKEGILKE